MGDNISVVLRLGMKNRFTHGTDPWTLATSQVITEKMVSDKVEHDALARVLAYHEIPIESSDLFGAVHQVSEDNLLKLIARQYIPGRSLKRGELITDQINQDRLSSLVNLFHKNGIARIDLDHAENIILGNDGLVYVGDVGHCIFEDSRFIRSEYFKEMKDKDQEDLKYRFGEKDIKKN